MAQSFLLSSFARKLSPLKIARLSDAEAFSLLHELRWRSENEQVCPKCGVQHKAYFISTRKQWRCKHCKHTFIPYRKSKYRLSTCNGRFVVN